MITEQLKNVTQIEEQPKLTVKPYSKTSKWTEYCLIDCSSQDSDKCQKTLEVLVSGVKDNIKRNNGNYICRPCSTFLKSEREFEKKSEEKKKIINPKLEIILEDRKNKKLSGETGVCSKENHEICVKNCIPRYPYKKDLVPMWWLFVLLSCESDVYMSTFLGVVCLDLICLGGGASNFSPTWAPIA